MIKHNFKIGGKVKLKDPTQFRCGGKPLTIIDFVDSYIHVVWDGVKYDYLPLYPKEIEPYRKINEQLLLFEL